MDGREAAVADCRSCVDEERCEVRMKQPIRVLQIIGDVVGGGVEQVILNYYRHIDKSKVQFDFVVHNGALQTYIDNVEALGGKVYQITPYKKNPLKTISEMYSIMNGRYRIVHSNMNALSVFPLFAAYLAGVPVRILHNHSTDTKAEPLRTFIKHLLRPFARLFANQYWACSRLAGEWMYGKKAVEEGKVTIINNAIDLKKFAFDEGKRRKLREELGLQDCFVVGHVGRFMKQKNHDFLIDIFAEVSKKQDKARLLLVGDGPLKSKIEDKVKALGLEEKVIFTGVRSDVADLYNVMDVFVLPSFYEGLPVVGVEVQANGLPFLCSSNVTKEILISDSIKLLELEQGSNFWADKIIEFVGKERKAVSVSVSQSGFDIGVEAEKLGKKYEEFIKMMS